MVANAVVTDWPSGSANTGWPQEPTGMLMPGRVQGWPAGTQRAANSAERLLSQAVAYWDVGQYRDGDRFLRNRGTGGELLDLRLGSAAVANSNDPRFLASEDSGYVYLPGALSNNLSVPDEAALQLTGDLDLRAQFAADDWTPSLDGTLLARYLTGNISYVFLHRSAGTLRFTWSADGSTTTIATSTASVSAADGNALWCRVTLDVDNGASGSDVKFYTSTDGVTWTQLGSTITTAGTTSVFAGTANISVGSLSSGTSTMANGKVYRAIIKDGIDGTTVLDIDCDAITSGSTTSFTAATGQTVTINRSTSGRKSVAVPSRFKGGQPVMLLGTDDFLEVQDAWQHGLLNFNDKDSFTVLAVVRRWNNQAGQAVISKQINTTLSEVNLGWSLAAATVNRSQVTVSNGLVRVVVENQNYVSGPVSVNVAVRNASSRIATGYAGGQPLTVADLTRGSFYNQHAVRVGRHASVGADYMEGEFYGAAVFRRALSPAEITTLSNYFTGRIA